MAPHPFPTTSYWNKSPIPLNGPPRLPNSFRERPIVIIGSGITAVSIAYSLLSLAPTAHLLVLDGRSICDGATGRNGGHCKVVPHQELAKLTKRFGAEKAAGLVRFQLRHLESLREVCELVDRENGKDKTEFREVETVDLYIEDDLFAEAKDEVEAMKKVMPDVAVEVWEAESAKKHFGVNSQCHGAISYKAGALYPYRLVMSLWPHLLKKYPSRLTVMSKTMVTSIFYDIQGPFMVQTTKGSISAEHIIYATNAYASEFIPPLKNRIVPARMYMIAQRPGARFQEFAGGRSWSVMYRGGFDYATQRPGADSSGDLLIGGGWNRSAMRGQDAINNLNDDRVDGMVIRYLESVFPSLFEKKEQEQKPGGAPADMAWSGIIGLTPDGLPFVGRLGTRGVIPEAPAGEERRPAEWISAGYCGEGMVFAFLCGAALAAHVAGRENEDLPPRPGVPGGKVSEWFPPELYVTKERLKWTVAEAMETRGLFG